MVQVLATDRVGHNQTGLKVVLAWVAQAALQINLEQVGRSLKALLEDKEFYMLGDLYHNVTLC